MNEETCIKYCELLKKHIDGTIKLDIAEIQIVLYYIQKQSFESFYFFAKHVIGFSLLTDETHKVWSDNIQKVINKTRRIMRLKPRATYKTTLYGVGLILWVWACMSQEIKIFYTSANSILLQEVSDQISSHIDNSDSLFRFVFGIQRDKKAKNTNEIFNIEGRTGKGFSLVLKTAGTGTAGLHPNLIIVDDPMDKNDRESGAIRLKKERWFDSLTPLIVPFEKEGVSLETILFIATRWHMTDLVDYILKMNKKKKDVDKWDIEIESIYNEDGKSNYPEFITDEKIDQVKSEIDSVFFACQYMNNPLPEGMAIFDHKRFHYTRIDQINPSVGQISCFFDPSMGKKTSDYPAVIWTHFHDNQLTLVDAIDEKIEISTLIPLIAKKNKMYNAKLMVFENNGTTLIEEALITAHKNINHHIQIDSIHHSTNKDGRITSMQPDIYSGFIVFLDMIQKRNPELWSQLIYYPVYGHDDFPDVIEMAISHYRQGEFNFERYEGIL